jgi:hypothetical protein
MTGTWLTEGHSTIVLMAASALLALNSLAKCSSPEQIARKCTLGRHPSKAAGVFCKLANMLGFELFDLICNLVQESGQGVRFVVANLTDQRVKVGYKTVVISNRFRGAQMQLIENIAGFSFAHLPTPLIISLWVKTWRM